MAVIVIIFIFIPFVLGIILGQYCNFIYFKRRLINKRNPIKKFKKYYTLYEDEIVHWQLYSIKQTLYHTYVTLSKPNKYSINESYTETEEISADKIFETKEELIKYIEKL